MNASQYHIDPQTNVHYGYEHYIYTHIVTTYGTLYSVTLNFLFVFLKYLIYTRVIAANNSRCNSKHMQEEKNSEHKVMVPHIEDGIALPKNAREALPEMSPSEELTMRSKTVKLISDLANYRE